MIKKKTSGVTAGIDDATKCPCIGSIFISGVVADKKTVSYWKKIGVKDSKLLTAKKRFELAPIIKNTALSYSIQEITPAMIDDKSFNLNAWEMITVLNIVQDLQQNSTFTTVFVDNWEVSEQLFKDRFSQLTSPEIQPILNLKNLYFDIEKLQSVEFRAEHRADENYTIVGAASILSKTSSDDQYKLYKELYGNFGSGSPADPQTRFFVWQHRHNPPHIIRKSWNTYQTLVILENIEDDPIYNRLQKKQCTKRANTIIP